MDLRKRHCPSPSLPRPVGEGGSDETSTEIHAINPSDLSLARTSRTERKASGISPGLHTPPLPATHAGAGTGLPDTDPGLHLRHQPDLQTHNPLTTCDLVSHCPLDPGTVVLTRPALNLRSAPAASQRPVLNPRTTHPSERAQSNEASSRVHGYSPVRSSPCLWPPDGAEALGLLPGASHPAVTSDARPGGDGP
jgi:hypothetical protein